MKKVLVGIGTVAAVVVLLPLFAAFEAHVVNVTATIENALTVPIKDIEFGTVFPQEHLFNSFDINLSESFKAEDRVDDVEYIIRQKPQCAITSNGGKNIDVSTLGTGEVIVDHAVPKNYWTDCGPAPRATSTGEVWGPIPELCIYLSFHPDDKTDHGLTSFHKPFWIGTSTVIWNDASGRLAKSDGDESDHWTVDLAVPCIVGHCAQDWGPFVQSLNPHVNHPYDYTQPLVYQGRVFGCNLWVEVAGVSVNE